MATKKPLHYWLMKSEPEVFSFEDLTKASDQITSWEGVRNYQARNFMRDVFRKGDKVLFYHSNTDEPCVAGIAEVVREGYPDPTALDPKSRYFDPAARAKGISPWIMVDIKAIAPFKEPVTREKLKKEPRLRDMMVLRRGSRLSVQPVTEKEFLLVCVLGEGRTKR